MASELWAPQSDDCAGLSGSIRRRPCRAVSQGMRPGQTDFTAGVLCGRMAAYAGGGASLETH